MHEANLSSIQLLIADNHKNICHFTEKNCMEVLKMGMDSSLSSRLPCKKKKNELYSTLTLQ